MIHITRPERGGGKVENMKEWVVYYNYKGKLLSYKITEGAIANSYGKEVHNIADAIEAFEKQMVEFERQDVSRYNIVSITYMGEWQE